MGQETLTSLAMTSAMLKGGASSVKELLGGISDLIEKFDKQGDNDTIEKSENKKHQAKNNEIHSEGMEGLRKQQEEYQRENKAHVEKNHKVRTVLQAQQWNAQRKQLKKQKSIAKSEEEGIKAGNRMQGEMLHMAQQNWVATTSITKELVRIHSVLVGDRGKAAEHRLQRMSAERGIALGRESELEAEFRKKNKEIFGKKGYTNLSEFNVAIKENEKLEKGDRNQKITDLADVMEGKRLSTAISAQEKLKGISKERGWDETINKSKLDPPKGTLLNGLLVGIPNSSGNDSTGSGLYQQQRAPAGGVDVGDKFFAGGQLLPHSENLPFTGGGTPYQGAGSSGGCCDGIEGIFKLLKGWNTRDSKSDKRDLVKSREEKLDLKSQVMGGLSSGQGVKTGGTLGAGVGKELYGLMDFAVANPKTTAAVVGTGATGSWVILKKVVSLSKRMIKTMKFDKFAAWLLTKLPILAPIVAGGPIAWIAGIASFIWMISDIYDALLEIEQELAGTRQLDTEGKQTNREWMDSLQGSLVGFDGNTIPPSSYGGGGGKNGDGSEASKTLEDLDADNMNKAFKALNTVGSAYVHDTHAESWLEKIFGVLVGKKAHAVNVRPGGFGPFGFGGFGGGNGGGGGYRGIMPAGGGGGGRGAGPLPSGNVTWHKYGKKKMSKEQWGELRGQVNQRNGMNEPGLQGWQRTERNTAARKDMWETINKMPDLKVKIKPKTHSPNKDLQRKFNQDKNIMTDKEFENYYGFSKNSGQQSNSGFGIGDIMLSLLGIGKANAEFFKQGDNIDNFWEKKDENGKPRVIGGDNYLNNEKMSARGWMDMQALEYFQATGEIPKIQTGKGKQSKTQHYPMPIDLRRAPKLRNKPRGYLGGKKGIFDAMSAGSDRAEHNLKYGPINRLKQRWKNKMNELDIKDSKFPDITGHRKRNLLKNNLIPGDHDKDSWMNMFEGDPDDLTPLKDKNGKFILGNNDLTNLLPMAALSTGSGGGGGATVINNNTTNTNSSPTVVAINSTAHAPALPSGIGSSMYFA